MKNHLNYSITKAGEVTNLVTGKRISVFNRGRYLAVALGSRREEQKIKFLHRLLAEEFLPNPLELPLVNHIDGNPYNNSLENLEWATYFRNNKHAYTHGKQVKRRGILSYSAKLTLQNVEEIRCLLAQGSLPQQVIADRFKVSRGCILGIHQGKSWRS